MNLALDDRLSYNKIATVTILCKNMRNFLSSGRQSVTPTFGGRLSEAPCRFGLQKLDVSQNFPGETKCSMLFHLDFLLLHYSHRKGHEVLRKN